MKHTEIVIRHSLAGNILLLSSCTIFTALGILMLQDEGVQLLGILAIGFFGFGGFLYTLLMVWKPAAVISTSGITTFYGWGGNFVAWENVNGFEVVEQSIRFLHTTRTNRYIGIYVKNPEGLAGTSNFSKALSKKVTCWEKVPDLLIHTPFSREKLISIMEILHTTYHEYQNTQIK